jgi:hypothetical protein
MRSIAVAGAALAAVVGLVATEPAAAFDNGHNYQGTDIYVHHYVYGPPGRIRHVYHFQRQGPTTWVSCTVRPILMRGLATAAATIGSGAVLTGVGEALNRSLYRRLSSSASGRPLLVGVVA